MIAIVPCLSILSRFNRSADFQVLAWNVSPHQFGNELLPKAHGRQTEGPKPIRQYCLHGADAKGVYAVGAPNLTDNIWLYRGSESAIMKAIHEGRANVMPSFKDFLGEEKVHHSHLI